MLKLPYELMGIILDYGDVETAQKYATVRLQFQSFYTVSEIHPSGLGMVWLSRKSVYEVHSSENL